MNTNTKEISKAIQAHILQCIDSEGRDSDPITEKEKVQFLIDVFNSEYVNKWNIAYYKNNAFELFKNWCLGLPSAFNIEYEYYKILEFMDSIGLPKPENKTHFDSAELYYRLVYRELSKLARKHSLSIFKI